MTEGWEEERERGGGGGGGGGEESKRDRERERGKEGGREVYTTWSRSQFLLLRVVETRVVL